MFYTYLSVILFVGRGVSVWCHFMWLPGPMFLLEGLSPWSHVPAVGVVSEGGLCPGCLCAEGSP